MKNAIIQLAAVSAMPIPELPPVTAALPSVVHSDMDVTTNIGSPAEVTP